MKEDPYIHAFMHCALMHGGLSVATEMHGRMMQSGFYDKVDSVTWTICGPKDQADYLHDYVLKWHPKTIIRYAGESFECYEYPALKLLEAKALESKDDETILIYLHTKGASNCRPDVPDYIQHNLREWRGHMCAEIMDIEAVKMYLDRFTSCGPLHVLADHPDNTARVDYYAGNFWACTPLHIKRMERLSPNNTDRRNFAEEWIGTSNGPRKNTFGAMSACDHFDLYDFSNKCHPVGPLDGYKGTSNANK